MIISINNPPLLTSWSIFREMLLDESCKLIFPLPFNDCLLFFIYYYLLRRFGWPGMAWLGWLACLDELGCFSKAPAYLSRFTILIILII